MKQRGGTRVTVWLPCVLKLNDCECVTDGQEVMYKPAERAQSLSSFASFAKEVKWFDQYELSCMCKIYHCCFRGNVICILSALQNCSIWLGRWNIWHFHPWNSEGSIWSKSNHPSLVELWSSVTYYPLPKWKMKEMKLCGTGSIWPFYCSVI